MNRQKSLLSRFNTVTFLILILGVAIFSKSLGNQAQAKQEEENFQELIAFLNTGDYKSCEKKATELMNTNTLFMEEAKDLSQNCSTIDLGITFKNQGQLNDGITAIQAIPPNSLVAERGYQELVNWVNIPVNAKSADIKQQLGEPLESKLNRDGWTKVWQEVGYDIDPTQWINRQNTYQIVPNQISLNLILDCPVRGRGTVHQTEFTFNSSIPLAKIEVFLAKLTKEENLTDNQAKLRDVYDKKVQLREFSAGNFVGAIKRDDENNIHLYLREASTLQ